MFRPIRKKKREISEEAAKALLKSARRGVLAVNGDEGYPYAVPINFYYDEENERILFHGAKAGHKKEAIMACDKVCFTVFGNERIKDLAWAPYVQSTVVFGRCSIVEDQEVCKQLVRILAQKYYPNEQLIDEEIAQDGHAMHVFEIKIEHLSGKEIQER